MKTISISLDEYEKEKEDFRINGCRSGFNHAVTEIFEYLNGTNSDYPFSQHHKEVKELLTKAKSLLKEDL